MGLILVWVFLLILDFVCLLGAFCGEVLCIHKKNPIFCVEEGSGCSKDPEIKISN